MIIEHGESQNLVSWLIGQEKVLRYWIDEMVAVSADAEFIQHLEQHRGWLCDRIGELRERAS